MTKAKPFEGKVTLGTYSSLRKRMRSARRGLTSVLEPTEKAMMRHAWYRKKLMWDAIRSER